MVKRFRVLLAKELYGMICEQDNTNMSRKTHRPKQESEANISVASSEGKGEPVDMDVVYFCDTLRDSARTTFAPPRDRAGPSTSAGTRFASREDDY
jgi:hypothetical protein